LRSERILDVAATREVDLIVMGLNCSTGIRARIAAHLPGSTVFDVISEARCPVLTVPYAG
jgi:nucleotide-binding universal stress UspA family protein